MALCPREPLCSRELLNRIKVDEHMLPGYVTNDMLTPEQLCKYSKIMEEYKRMNTIEKRRNEYKQNSLNVLCITTLFNIFLFICFCLICINLMFNNDPTTETLGYIMSPVVAVTIIFLIANWILP